MNTFNRLMELEDACNALATTESVVGKDMREPQFKEAWERFERATSRAMHLHADPVAIHSIRMQILALKEQAPEYTHGLLGKVMFNLDFPEPMAAPEPEPDFLDDFLDID